MNIYKKAREYLGLSREQVCEILKIDMESIVAIEEGNNEVNSYMKKQFMKLYGLTDDIIECRAINVAEMTGLSVHDAREVMNLILFKEEYKKGKDII